MKGLRKAYRGERGFTLVELLVVIVILGVLAAVATLAVTRFMGSGNLESANTELHQAQTAVVACMAEAGASRLDAEVTGWEGGVDNSPQATVGDNVTGTTYFAYESLQGRDFKAAYDVDIEGNIDYAVVLDDGGWSGIVWDDDCWIKIVTP